MTQDNLPVKPGRSFAALENVRGCMELVNELIDRPPNTDGIGVMYGPSGYGKTEAAKFARNRTRGIKVDVYESWNRRTFVQAILSEAGYPNARGTVAELTKHAIMVLGEDPRRPLIVDEADTAYTKGFLGIVRELHDISKVAVLLVGEELFPKRLMSIERLHGRVRGEFPAQPASPADCRKLADLFLVGAEIDDALLDLVRVKAEGRARRVVGTMHKMTEFARNTGIASLTPESYRGSGAIFSTNELRGRKDFIPRVVAAKGAAA